MDSIDESRTQLVLRRNMSNNWIWLLLTADSHVVNRSDAEFATKIACMIDAGKNGLTLTG